jgi:hypothetical protein
MTREERLARNESVFREVNERIREVNPGNESQWGAFLCECGDNSCTMTIDATLKEYEETRGRGDRFMLKEGHEDTSIEQVVSRNERFVVVEKTGEGATVAHRLDPRR